MTLIRSSSGGAASSTDGFSSIRFFWFIQWVSAGHSLGGCLNQGGPFHQSEWSISVLGEVPREAMSAGLSVVEMCLHWFEGTLLTVSSTQLQT